MIQDKKEIGKVRIYVDLGKLNDAFLHDPFPTPFTADVLESVSGQEMYSFTDEVLESIDGQEMYLFIDGFSGYHQVRIVQEDHHKINFVIEWGCY